MFGGNVEMKGIMKNAVVTEAASIEMSLDCIFWQRCTVLSKEQVRKIPKSDRLLLSQIEPQARQHQSIRARSFPMLRNTVLFLHKGK
jgi:hypothetical protein